MHGLYRPLRLLVCLPRGQVCEKQALLLPPHHCRIAYNRPWGGSTIRYVGDGRPFWRHIVTQSTGCCSEEMFEELYDYYARGTSYFLMPGAAESLQRIRNAGGVLGVRLAGRLDLLGGCGALRRSAFLALFALPGLMRAAADLPLPTDCTGIKTAIVSNFDTRLWRILRELHIDQLFDAVIISAGAARGPWRERWWGRWRGQLCGVAGACPFGGQLLQTEAALCPTNPLSQPTCCSCPLLTPP